jgi:hypothetical protein
MDITEVLKITDELVSSQTKQHLDNIQRGIILGVWEGKTYWKIATEYNFSEGHVRDIGYKLWKVLSDVLGEKVNKSNFRVTLERFINTKPVTSVSLISHSYQNQAPPKPSYFVERPEVIVKLKELLLSKETAKTETLVITAIYGLGGIGKSTLAAALAQEKDVQAYFPDGIFWATLGQQPDISSFLHGWIQSLGDYDFKPTGIDAASLQLRTLLADKKALLVVDDLWNAEDVEPFRVAGDGCKLLVTTRETPVLGAIRYDLDIMTETQSLALLTAYLKHELTLEEQKQAKILAKIVGYLPLALELATAQIEDGISWDELIEELRAEIPNLEILDRLEVEDITNQEKRKHYSLIASFNLSLKRLSPQRLQQFIWLGVLPDDVTITEKMATTLWDCRLTEARKTLRYLRGKALLLTGVSGEQITNYRVHDLLHDLARNLIQARPLNPPILGDFESSSPQTWGARGAYQLPGLGLSISEAHQQFLSRYQKQTKNGLWHSLEDDGYIYNQLIWHLEKAGKIGEIHQLLREETAEGMNGWYSKCEKEAKTATFIKDVSRAWQLAEADFANNPSQSIGLQVRYVLITTSLNSLAGNIPPELIAALIKHEIWTPAQGLAYVRQSQDDEKQAEGLEKITPYLPPALLPEALEVARAIRDESHRAEALTGLAPHLPEVLPEALEVAKAIRYLYERARALTELASHLPKVLPEALAIARAIGYEYHRAWALAKLAPYLPEVLPEALAAAKAVELHHRARELTSLAPYLPKSLLPEALEIAREIRNESDRVRALTGLVPHLPQVLPEALDVARAIGDKYNRAIVLMGLVPYVPQVLPEALELGRATWDRGSHEEEKECAMALALAGLAPYLPESLLPKALEVARAIRSEHNRLRALTGLAPHLPQVLPEALELARVIEDKFSHAMALTGLAPHLPEVLPEVLELVEAIDDYYLPDVVLAELALRLPESFLPEALEVARAIEDESERALALTGLAAHLPEVLPETLEVVRAIENEYQRAFRLTELAPHLPESLLPEALEVARAIEDESDRARALIGLAPYLPEVLPEALDVASTIGNKYNRAIVLMRLDPHLPEVLLEAIDVVRGIGDEYDRARALTGLAPYLPESLLPEALDVAREIKSKYFRAEALTGLAPHFPEVLLETLEVARAEGEYSHAMALIELAPYFPEVLQLPEVLEVARAIGDEEKRAEALQALTKLLTPANVDQSLWEKTLHALGTLTRPSFLETIPNLVPLILHFGGVEALREVYQGIREVSRWWR